MAAAKKSRPFSLPLRKNSKASPWNELVPDLVTALTAAAVRPPSEASCVLVLSRNSCSASGNGSGMFCPNHVSRCEAPSREYCTLKDVPPATEIWTPPFIVYAGATFCTTAAPPNEIRSVGCRPLSGRSRIRCVFSTIVPTPTLRVSTCATSDWTSTLCATSPTSIFTSTTGLLPTCSTMPVCAKVRKPGNAASSRYGPSGRLGST